MNGARPAEDSVALTIAQALIAAAAVTLFLLPLATTPGLLAAIAGTIAGYLIARGASQLRLAAGLLLAGLTILAAHLVSSFVLAREFATTTLPIQLADAIYLGLGTLGIFFAIRLLAHRHRAFSILEVAVLVAALGHTFSDHRHHRIHQPRWLSDWAWSQGIDPQTILSGAGIAVVVLAAIMLLRRQTLAKLILSLLLLMTAATVGFLFARDQHIDIIPEDSGLGLTAQSKPSSGAGRRPDPVAVAVLHDDLPDDADILYFRQTVRSRLSGDRLVEDNTGRFDLDVFRTYPGDDVVRPPIAVQSPAFHRRFPTEMYLLVAHPQPFGIGHPVALGPLENPDPRRFVAAYQVESMLPTSEPARMMGRTAIPEGWTPEQREHYLAIPDDPRYATLAQELVREIDPRFVGDQVVNAYAIKRYLEVEGFYSLQQKEMIGTDPTARFLFGDLKGYCVHFAHAAVFLFRSQGIPARVALGYAVRARRRGAGSSLLIMGNEAHAWPEIYLEGVGWVTFDVYPERSDEPPQPPVDEDLESLLGEIARKDPTGGRAADPGTRFEIPWRELGLGLAGLLAGLTLVAYAIKIGRRLRGATARLVYRATLDRLSDLGLARRHGESRERHAARVASVAPSFAPLTNAHLRWALGPRDGSGDRAEHERLATATRAELRENVSLRRRIAGALHPIGWFFTR